MNEMRGERLQVMLSPEELAALDDFRTAPDADPRGRDP